MNPAPPLADRTRRFALYALLLMPLGLMHAKAVGEACMALVGLLFLYQSARRHDWAWLRTPWVATALVLWLWVVVTSAHGPGGLHALGEGLLTVRYWVFAAALEGWVLADPQARRWLRWVVMACAIWIALQCWQQYLTGTDLFGYPRWGDGSLTGPFSGPRAGPAFVVMLYPALLPPVMALLGRTGWPARLAGGALAVAGLATLLLIGQRMPALLGLFGLAVAGLLLPRLRWAALMAFAVGVALLAALPLISPPTYHKLVLHFLSQMSHFRDSPYGQLYVRASQITFDHPWLGVGFDGFRTVCNAAQYHGGLPWLGIPPVPVGMVDTGCAIHPHNFYLEAATIGGLPALVLFAAVTVQWLVRVGGGLWRAADPVRVALFVAVLNGVWPIASTSGFYTMPISGWLFVMVGWALAERRAAGQAALPAA